MHYIKIKNQFKEQENICPSCGMERNVYFEGIKTPMCKVLLFDCGSKTDFMMYDTQDWHLIVSPACKLIKELKDKLNHLTSDNATN